MNDLLSRLFDDLAGTAAWDGCRPRDINDQNLLGDTALHTVCTWGEVEPVRVLIGLGADVNAPGDLASPPLMNALIGGNPEVVKLLLASGADPNLKNREGWSALSFARMRKMNAKLVDLLEKYAQQRTGQV